MIDQVRHLQSSVPFETFALELSSGRVVQIYDAHFQHSMFGRPGMIDNSKLRVLA